jgi:hypothetical protein
MPETKEWTLMFYFASDNPLAPGIISQLKALKAAGFHKQANVIAQFDPYTEGTPTHIFDVNIVKKLESPEEFNIGFDSEDPFIRNLVEDKLWRDERDRSGKKLIRDRIKAEVRDYAPGVPRSNTAEVNGHRSELSPLQSLDEFLRFCSSRYPAKHYMLFILGHGVVVGNDLFLYDEHADQQSLSLTGLRTVLENFKLDIQSHSGSFEMVSFHSCSVSSLEVTFELKDTAKYMLASQGATFIGSWPYREILLRIFKDLKTNRNQLNNGEIKTMLTRIFSYCLHNSTDFLLAGYPFDLCLTDLSKMEAVKPQLSNLTKALIDGLQDPETKEAILLAHLESQSFYGEMYTDIIDFCRCLFMRLKRTAAAATNGAASNGASASENGVRSSINPKQLEGSSINLPALRGETAVATVNTVADAEAVISAVQEGVAMSPLQTACVDVINAIRATIVKRGFAGPEYQYSRGLSIYFPWSRPSVDSGVLANYSRYQLATKQKPEEKPEEKQKDKQKQSQATEKPKYDETLPPTWFDFLDRYFDDTRRHPVIFEEDPEPALFETAPEKLSPAEELFEDKIAVVYTQAAPSVAPNVPGTLQKGDKTDPMGGDCVCPSIKNYFRDTRPRKARKRPSRESLAFAQAFFKQSA